MRVDACDARACGTQNGGRGEASILRNQFCCGVEKKLTRRVHTSENGGANPPPATKLITNHHRIYLPEGL